MTQPYPLPRSKRETDINAGDGGATYGPFTFKIFDTADVVAMVRHEDSDWWEPSAVTVAKVAGAPLDDFTVTFPVPLPDTSSYVVLSRRLHERLVAVTKGGAISAIELEKELSKQGSVIEELRRDVDRAIALPPGSTASATLPLLADAETIIWNDAEQRFVRGPTAGAIADAVANAQIAAAAAAYLRERYLGGFASDAAASAFAAAEDIELVAGVRYFNTTTNTDRVWSGSAWVAAPDVADGSVTDPKIAAGSNLRSLISRRFDVGVAGAIGDGSTLDTAAVQSAFNAVVAFGAGAQIFFPKGTYLVSDLSATGLSGVSIVGDGAVLKLPDVASGANNDILKLVNCNDITISGVTFEGNRSNRVGAGGPDASGTAQDELLVLQNCKRVLVQNNFFKSVRIDAITILDGADKCEDIFIDRNRFADCSFDVWADTTAIASIRVHYTNNVSTGSRVALQFNLCGDMKGTLVVGNHITARRSAIAFAEAAGFVIRDNTAHVSGQETANIGVIHVEDGCANFVISGNSTTGVDCNGIFIVGPQSDYVIDGNRCGPQTGTTNGRRGIFIVGQVLLHPPQSFTPWGGPSNTQRRGVVSNNTCINNNGIQLFKIDANLSSILISENIVVNSGEYGIAVLGSVSSDLVGIIIASNIVDTTVNDGIFVRGASRYSIKDNIVSSAGAHGIGLTNAIVGSVGGNTIRSPAGNGINEGSGSNQNRITDNLVSNPGGVDLAVNDATTIAPRSGTWTPVLTFGTPGDLAVAYATRVGTFTINDQREVTLNFNIVTSAFTHTTAASTLRLSGAPFASANAPDDMPVGSLAWGGITKANYTQIVPRILPGSNLVDSLAAGSGQASASVSVTDMPTAGQVRLVGSIKYKA